MKFIADLHVHSRYSRATARDIDLETMHVTAQLKGIHVLATGDVTHPAWFDEIRTKLVPAEEGLYRLDDSLARVCDRQVPASCRQPVRFVLGTEISNIYKKASRTRKNHNLVYLPDLDCAERFNHRLDRIGNIHSDGRPILGLDARDLLEIVLETDPRAYLVPAHIWTPWFSLLGSKSGFDSLEACFEDLSGHIFAAETGLSSDPPMNWRVSGLDRLTLVSNSDAHSPAKLGREANRFDTDLSYDAIRQALEDPSKGFLGTIEFHPQEGKYHLDGHRKCNLRLTPQETRRIGGICPVCHRPMTLGVLYRVMQLADRAQSRPPADSPGFCHRVPLTDILSELLECGPATKKVRCAYDQALSRLGSEMAILDRLPPESLAAADIPLLDEAVRRMRQGKLMVDPGYDGAFGTVRIFEPGERRRILGQQTLFSLPSAPPAPRASIGMPEPPLAVLDAGLPTTSQATPDVRLNRSQRRAVTWPDGPLLIVAGPGTGKTFTLTRRIARLIETGRVPAGRILAVTFTHKAAEEMRRRVVDCLGEGAALPEIGTFHALCFKFLQELEPGRPLTIVDADQRMALIADAMARVSSEDAPPDFSIKDAASWIEAAKQRLEAFAPGADGSSLGGRRLYVRVYRTYQRLLQLQGLVDYDDLLGRMVIRLENDPSLRDKFRRRFAHVFIDEYQDLNRAQYRLVRALVPVGGNLCVIGDPDQCIYGFRGSDRSYFRRFTDDYGEAGIIRLERSYRAPQTVLDAAGQVMSRGTEKREMVRLYADVPGRVLSVMHLASERAEAVAIGRVIETMVGGSGFEAINFGKLDGHCGEADRGFGDFAVLFRTLVQGRFIEEVLSAAGIPCQLASRRRLLDSPPVAGLVSLLRVLADRASLIDLPQLLAWVPPAPGKTTADAFRHWCYGRRFDLTEGLAQVARLPVDGLSARRQHRLVALADRLAGLKRENRDKPLAERMTGLVRQTGLGEAFSDPDTAADLETLTEIATTCRDETDFFTRLALCTDTDVYDSRAQRVALLSLHAAKGLEFPVVFIAGCEEGLIPLQRPGTTTDPDEERRLFYVGLTRASDRLFLCAAGRRTIRGRIEDRRPSRFLADIDPRLKADETPTPGAGRKPRQTQLSLF